MSVEWKEPPAPKGRGSSWIFTPEFYEELKTKPNEWALFKSSAYAAQAYKLSKRMPDLQVTCRRAGENEKKTPLYDIYVRYVSSVDAT